MTKSELKRESSVRMSSVMPSLKYACSWSALILLNGRTAIDGLDGKFHTEPIDDRAEHVRVTSRR